MTGSSEFQQTIDSSFSSDEFSPEHSQYVSPNKKSRLNTQSDYSRGQPKSSLSRQGSRLNSPEKVSGRDQQNNYDDLLDVYLESIEMYMAQTFKRYNESTG